MGTHSVFDLETNHNTTMDFLAFIGILALTEAAPIEWDATRAFTERMMYGGSMVFPAFIGGAVGGLVLWCAFILLYKAGGHIFKKKYKSDSVQTQNKLEGVPSS